jgi:hypothetical protein
LKRADAIAARHPRSREQDLEKCERIRSRLGIPKPVSAAEAYATAQELRRRDQAAGVDAALRLAARW